MPTSYLQHIQSRIGKVLGENGGDVLLIVPPFFNIDFIAIGPYILQQMGKKHGYQVDILQLDQLVGSIIGADEYRHVQDSPTYQLLGERLFARAAYQLPSLGHNHDALLDQKQAISSNKTANLYVNIPDKIDLEHYLQMEQQCQELIEIAAEVIASYQYQVIGLSIGFCNQINASIAMINHLKQLQPDCSVIVGGSYCDGDKVPGVLSLCPHIDHIFSGESEYTFIDYLNTRIQGHTPAQKIIKTNKGIHPDEVPLPDYGAYANQVKIMLGDDFYNYMVKAIWYESNRGCWWADLSKCTFCGISDSAFRQKSVTHVTKDLDIISSKTPGKYIFFTDLIMTESFPKKYLATVNHDKQLPVIGMQLKVGRTLQEVLLLHQINARIILPGIESFSTSLLKKMKKGTTGKQNLYFIRNTVSLGIHAQYSLLWGFPNDTQKEYKYLLELIPLIVHLKPPRLFEGAQISRDAPLYRDAEKLGVTNLEPWNVYDMAYPPDVDKSVFANYYTGSFNSYAYEHPELIEQIKGLLIDWKELFGRVELSIMEIGFEQYVIKDTRMVDQESPITYLIDRQMAIDLMSLQRYNNTNQTWGIERNLGVIMDGWFVPIITANATLLVELDQSESHRKSKNTKKTIVLNHVNNR